MAAHGETGSARNLTCGALRRLNVPLLGLVRDEDLRSCEGTIGQRAASRRTLFAPGREGELFRYTTGHSPAGSKTP